MKWDYQFTTKEIPLPPEKEAEWRAGIRLLLSVLEHAPVPVAGELKNEDGKE